MHSRHWCDTRWMAGHPVFRTVAVIAVAAGAEAQSPQDKTGPPDGPNGVQQPADDRPPGAVGQRPQQRSMVQRGRRPRRGNRGGPRFPQDVRAIDGVGNNRQHPLWGSPTFRFLRAAPAAYEDGVDTPAGANRPNPRLISNACVAQPQPIDNSAGASDYVWQWGQFLDHDIVETPIAEPEETFDIAVPAGDPWFDPDATGDDLIPLSRSSYDVVGGVRQQANHITAFIDASNVYGSDAVRAAALRELDGSGRLRTSAGDLMPFNDAMLDNAPSSAPSFFLGGDIRANEQVALTAMHTLFVREHNFWADTLAEDEPQMSGEQIYHRAGAIVAAEMQAITYREFLPALLGPEALAPYTGYDPQVNPSIDNVFATAAYRFGHSMLSPTLLRVDANGNEIAAGHLALASAFFNPGAIINEGIDPVLRGLAQMAQEIDTYIIDDVRNFLFGAPGSGGFDLASLNIQRGRDHGLPGFNSIRKVVGLPPLKGFGHFPPIVRDNLAAAYASPDDLDPWVGGLAEPHHTGGVVGQTWYRLLRDQFERLRDGDRFWYESYLPQDMVEMVEEQTLATIIRRNTVIGSELQDNVFLVP